MSVSSVLSSAVSGALVAQGRMAVSADNLVNMNTPGYKSQQFHQASLSSDDGHGVVYGRTKPLVDVSGLFMATGNVTDIAISGKGSLVVAREGEDSFSYSNGGAFSFNANGALVNGEGYVLQGFPTDASGKDLSNVLEPVETPGAVGISNITPTGLIYTIYDDGIVLPAFRLPLVGFANEAGLANEGGNVFSETTQSGPGHLDAQGLGRIESSTLEGSNVNAAGEMTTLIQAKAAYGASLSLIRVSQDMDDALNAATKGRS